MIIPTKITDYSQNRDLLEFAIFAACVAGKNSDQIANKVNALWMDSGFRTTLTIQFMQPPNSETAYLLYLRILRGYLERYKMGQYARLSRVVYLLNQHSLILKTMLWNQLVNLKGIGPKTAAFFLLHSRPHFDIPVIDVHIVKYMASKGITIKVTSDIQKYLEYAALVKAAFEKDFPILTLAQADLHVWTTFSGRA